jgi:hypothetical protein
MRPNRQAVAVARLARNASWPVRVTTSRRHGCADRHRRSASGRNAR